MSYQESSQRCGASVTKADLLGREDGRLGLYLSWLVVAGAFPVKAQHSPLQSPRQVKRRQIPRLHSRNPSPPMVVVVGLSSARVSVQTID